MDALSTHPLMLSVFQLLDSESVLRRITKDDGDIVITPLRSTCTAVPGASTPETEVEYVRRGIAFAMYCEGCASIRRRLHQLVNLVLQQPSEVNDVTM